MEQLKKDFIAFHDNAKPETTYTSNFNYQEVDNFHKAFYQAFTHHLVGALSIDFNSPDSTIDKQILINSLNRALKFAKETEQRHIINNLLIN